MTTEFAADIAALRDAALGYAGRHQLIPDLIWPEGVRMAVNFTADLDAMLLRRLYDEPVGQLAKGEFGGRVGIWRLLDLFDAHAVKATIFTPGRICELYPRAVQASAQRGHEVADHMWEHRVPAEAELEADHLRKATAAIEALTGKRPVGTRSSHSLGLLKSEGYIYNSRLYADHWPYYLSDEAGENQLINLPFHFAIDDAMFFSFAWKSSTPEAQRLSDPDRVLDMWWEGFCQQYDRGGYLNVCLHPFVSGRAMRIEMLDRLITRMKDKPGVWFPTCEAVARHCIETHPPAGAGS